MEKLPPSKTERRANRELRPQSEDARDGKRAERHCSHLLRQLVGGFGRLLLHCYAENRIKSKRIVVDQRHSAVGDAILDVKGQPPVHSQVAVDGALTTHSEFRVIATTSAKCRPCITKPYTGPGPMLRLAFQLKRTAKIRCVSSYSVFIYSIFSLLNSSISTLISSSSRCRAPWLPTARQQEPSRDMQWQNCFPA